MGCNVGRQTVLKGETEKQLTNNLTPRQIQIVSETWEIVSKDISHTGVIIFQRLLTKYPELCKLFKKFMTLREDGTYDWDLGGLERHALLVMQALEAAIDNLDDSRVLAGILLELGRKHARYDVQEDMFDKLWDALKCGLEETLKDQMTKEVTQAWFYVFRYLSRHIIEGMRDYRRKSQ